MRCASDIGFEAADNLNLAHPLGGAPPHLCLGPFTLTKSDDNYAMESCVGLTVVRHGRADADWSCRRKQVWD